MQFDQAEGKKIGDRWFVTIGQARVAQPDEATADRVAALIRAAYQAGGAAGQAV